MGERKRIDALKINGKEMRTNGGKRATTCMVLATMRQCIMMLCCKKRGDQAITRSITDSCSVVVGPIEIDEVFGETKEKKKRNYYLL